MSEILQTNRLVLREIGIEDAPFILELLNTSGFLENIGDRNVRTLEDATKYIINGPVLSYQTNGYGMYLVELKETGEHIGMCGLVKRENLENVDLGFAFLPQYFRRGYAFESSQGVLNYSKHKFGFTSLYGITKPENWASIGVLEKLGFIYVKSFQLYPNESLSKLFQIQLK